MRNVTDTRKESRFVESRTHYPLGITESLQVVLVRDEDRTVITMANDFQGDVTTDGDMSVESSANGLLINIKWGSKLRGFLKY